MRANKLFSLIYLYLYNYDYIFRYELYCIKRACKTVIFCLLEIDPKALLVDSQIAKNKNTKKTVEDYET